MRTKRYYTSEGPPSLLTRRAQSDAITRQVEAFKASGGRIDVVPAGETGDQSVKRYGRIYPDVQA